MSRAGNIGAEITVLDLVQAETDKIDAAAADGVGGVADSLADRLGEMQIEHSHVTNIFPEDSDETVTFTAHASADTFGAWAEIVDNNAVTLSSKFAAAGGHITGIQAESASVDDKMYIFEISYGASNIIVATGRLQSATNKINAIQQMRMSSKFIPAGETIYYRIKCETGGANITAGLRYHID